MQGFAGLTKWIVGSIKLKGSRLKETGKLLKLLVFHETGRCFKDLAMYSWPTLTNCDRCDPGNILLITLSGWPCQRQVVI